MSSNTRPFQPPADASVRDNQNTSSSGIDYYQFSQGDWKAANAQRHASNGDNGCCKCEITDKPEDQATEKTIDDLRSAKSTAARLTALGKLADDGIEQFLMLDKDGTTRQYRIETEKCGNRTLVHCYGNDDKGEEQVVMRAARTAGGEFEQERNKDGKHVSYYGDIWTREMQGKSSLVGDASQFASHKPVPSGDNCHEKEVKEQRPTREPVREIQSPPRQQDCDRPVRGEQISVRPEPRWRGNDNDCVDQGPERRNVIRDTLYGLRDFAGPIISNFLGGGRQCLPYDAYREYPQFRNSSGCDNYYDRGRQGNNGFGYSDYPGINNRWNRSDRGNNHYSGGDRNSRGNAVVNSNSYNNVYNTNNRVINSGGNRTNITNVDSHDRTYNNSNNNSNNRIDSHNRISNNRINSNNRIDSHDRNNSNNRIDNRVRLDSHDRNNSNNRTNVRLDSHDRNNSNNRNDSHDRVNTNNRNDSHDRNNSQNRNDSHDRNNSQNRNDSHDRNNSHNRVDNRDIRSRPAVGPRPKEVHQNLNRKREDEGDKRNKA